MSGPSAVMAKDRLYAVCRLLLGSPCNGVPMLIMADVSVYIAPLCQQCKPSSNHLLWLGTIEGDLLLWY